MRNLVVTVLVMLTAAAIGTAANGAAAPAWKTFDLATRGLSVEMPGTPKKRAIHNQSFIGDITTSEYYVDAGRDTYSLEITDLPDFAVQFSGNDTIYDHAKGALLKKTLSKPVAFTDVTLDGVKGKRLVYDTPTRPGHPEMQGEARFFLVKDTLYIADAVVEMKGGEKKQERFFSSLEIKN